MEKINIKDITVSGTSVIIPVKEYKKLEAKERELKEEELRLTGLRNRLMEKEKGIREGAFCLLKTIDNVCTSNRIVFISKYEIYTNDLVLTPVPEIVEDMVEVNKSLAKDISDLHNDLFKSSLKEIDLKRELNKFKSMTPKEFKKWYKENK